jgi:hypothetical protein
MLFFSPLGTFVWTSAFSLTVATTSPVDFSVLDTTRSLEPEVRQATSQTLPVLEVVERNTVIKNSTTLDKSWKDAVLFSLCAAISSFHSSSV